MLKKLAFMALLLQKNELFILDEPFNGVDIQSNIILSAVIQKLKSAKKTLLISSHIYSSLQENCDEILVLNNGTFEEPVHKADFNRLGEQLKNDIVDTRLDGLEFWYRYFKFSFIFHFYRYNISYSLLTRLRISPLGRDENYAPFSNRLQGDF